MEQSWESDYYKSKSNGRHHHYMKFKYKNTKFTDKNGQNWKKTLDKELNYRTESQNTDIDKQKEKNKPDKNDTVNKK